MALPVRIPTAGPINRGHDPHTTSANCRSQVHRAGVVTHVSVTMFQRGGSRADGQCAGGVSAPTPRLYQALAQRAIFKATKYDGKHLCELDESRPQLRKALFGPDL